MDFTDHLVDLTIRTDSTSPGPDEHLELIPDLTTPGEMYGGVIGHHAPPEPDTHTHDEQPGA